GVEQQGQVAGDEAASPLRGEDAETVPPDELMELGRVGFGECGGGGHARGPGSRGGRGGYGGRARLGRPGLWTHSGHGGSAVPTPRIGALMLSSGPNRPDQVRESCRRTSP